MSLVDRIRACTRFDRASVTPFLIDGVRYGLLGERALGSLSSTGAPFSASQQGVSLDTDPALPEEDRVRARSASLEAAVDRMIETGVIRRRRSEIYEVVNKWGETPAARVDRAAMTAFGFLAFGVHVNGYTDDDDGNRRLWVARRSADRAIAPGKLDNIVAGGIGGGLTAEETLVKEAYEEAGLPASVARTARPAGTISYTTHDVEANGTGVRRDVLFIYDLALPATLCPVNTDGEVADFSLMRIDDVIERIKGSEAFKFNVAPVIVDFLIRHGHIGPDHPDYQEMTLGLHQGVDI